MMKNISKLIFMIACVILPAFAFGQTPSITYSEPVTTTIDSGGEFLTTTVLQVTGINSYAGLTLVYIVDDDAINLPYQVAVVPVMFQETPNNFVITIADSENPSGSFYQFALVDNASLNTVGISSFNIDNSSQFQTFVISPVAQSPIVEDDAGDGVFTGGDVPGDVDNTDCEGGIDSTDCENEIDSTNCEGGIDSTICEPPISFLQTTTIANPLGQDVDILDFLDQLFENFVKIALPILVLFTVYSGLLFVMARGNEEKLSDAKKNFLYVIIGSVIVFGAWTVAHLLAGTVEQFEAFYSVVKLLV